MALDELPDIGDIFNNTHHGEEIQTGSTQEDLIEQDIYLYISKGDNKWINVSFIDTAPSGIGIHVLLTVIIDFNFTDLDNVKLKFMKRVKNKNTTLKEIPVLVRWQERDPISGNMKLGLHFPGDIKNEPDLQDILKKLCDMNL